MAEVMSMLPENNEGQLNADELDSLQVGEQMQEAQDKRLAGKYNSAEELESAYLQLQKKLGSKSEPEETEVEEQEQVYDEEETESESYDLSLADRLWEESASEFSEETLKELAEAKPEDIAQMYLDYRSQNTKAQITEKDASILKDSVGGAKAYDEMTSWANENLSQQEIEMFDSVMDSGDPNSAYFAIQAMNFRYKDSVGFEGNLLQGKPATDKTDAFKSQAEVVAAMQDPRYDRDPAYRQQLMAKLEQSNVDF